LPPKEKTCILITLFQPKQPGFLPPTHFFMKKISLSKSLEYSSFPPQSTIDLLQ